MRFYISHSFKLDGILFPKGSPLNVFPTPGTELLILHKQKQFLVGPWLLLHLEFIWHPDIIWLISKESSMFSESVTGHLTEYFGTGPDGFHCWFKYLHSL